MTRAHRITLIAAFVLGGCTVSQAEIRTAKTSAYDADFAIVYSEVLDAVRSLYPENLQDDPARGVVSTVWHQVQFSSTQDDNRAQDRAAGAGSGNTLVGSQPRAGKRTFIRFDITVAGGRPWRVRVSGKASEWEAGNAQPTILKGAAKPQWLGPRIDALTVAIYRRLKKYAIPIKAEEVVEDDSTAVDKAIFGDIPDGAADVAAVIVNAIDNRTTAEIRTVLADDVIWSLGADGDADTAMVMWQADPAIFAALRTALTAGCRGTEVVTCPPAATETPGYVDWRLTIEQRGGAWKLTSFVTGD